jgi:hypothetical protein
MMMKLSYSSAVVRAFEESRIGSDENQPRVNRLLIQILMKESEVGMSLGEAVGVMIHPM